MEEQEKRGATKNRKANDRALDPASKQVLELMAEKQLITIWDRYDNMQPQCRFGKQGICCRICIMGPCRPKAIGDEEPVGVCGANADTIAARNLVRMIAAGTAAHSDHGREVAHTLLMIARGEAQDYRLADERK